MFPASQSSYTNFKFVLLVFALVLLAAAKATAATSAGWSISIAPSGTPSYKATWTSPSGSGSNTSTGTSFTPPTPATNSISVGTFGVASKPWPVFATKQGTATATFSLNVTITGTWQGPGTAPDSIEVIETSQVESGSTPTANSADTASDGLGDAYMAGYSQTPPSPVHITTVSTSGGSFTLSRSFSASATENFTNTQTYTGYMQAAAELVSYSLTVHATPYAYQQSNVGIDSNGYWAFSYTWLSTDGNLADLSDCYWHEYVTYPGTASPYVPPAPFTGVSVYNPTITPAAAANPPKNGTGGTTGYAMSEDNWVDEHIFWPVVSINIIQATVSASQQYEYYDSVTGQDNIPIPGDSSYTITRSVYQKPPYTTWYESVSKNNASNEEQLSGS